MRALLTTSGMRLSVVISGSAIRENARSLGVAERCRLVQGDVVALLQGGRLEGPFSWIFADPPWADDAGAAFLPALRRSGTVPPGATVVVERDGRSEAAPAPEGWARIRTAVYGRTALDIYLS